MTKHMISSKSIFLPKKLSSDKTDINKEDVKMDGKTRKGADEKPRSRVNQFIIECMFGKYFEEEKEEIASATSSPRNDGVPQRT